MVLYSQSKRKTRRPSASTWLKKKIFSSGHCRTKNCYTEWLKQRIEKIQINIYSWEYPWHGSRQKQLQRSLILLCSQRTFWVFYYFKGIWILMKWFIRIFFHLLKMSKAISSTPSIVIWLSHQTAKILCTDRAAEHCRVTMFWRWRMKSVPWAVKFLSLSSGRPGFTPRMEHSLASQKNRIGSLCILPHRVNAVDGIKLMCFSSCTGKDFIARNRNVFRVRNTSVYTGSKLSTFWYFIAPWSLRERNFIHIPSM